MVDKGDSTQQRSAQKPNSPDLTGNNAGGWPYTRISEKSTPTPMSENSPKEKLVLLYQ